MSDKLRAWLSEELEQRGWTHSELGRRAGVSQAAISNILSGNREAGADFCVKIAQALNEAPEKVLRLAEILPPASDDDPSLSEIIDTLRNMSPNQRKETLHYIRYLYQRGQEDD